MGVASMSGTFEKRDNNPRADLTGEAAVLRWLGEAEADGGLVCSRVVRADAHLLLEERIDEGTPTREKARLAGAALARTHSAGALWYGCPPPGWDGAGYVIGRSLTAVVARPACVPWRHRGMGCCVRHVARDAPRADHSQ